MPEILEDLMAVAKMIAKEDGDDDVTGMAMNLLRGSVVDQHLLSGSTPLAATLGR